MENRLFARLRTPVAIKYVFPDGSNGESRVNDISLEGASLPIRYKTDILPGSSLTLKIKLPKRKRETVISGEVVWLQEVEALKGTNYIAGIKFTKADPIDIEEILSALKTGAYFTAEK